MAYASNTADIAETYRAFLADHSADLSGLRETISKSWMRSSLRRIDPLSPIADVGAGDPLSGTYMVNKRPTLFEYLFSIGESLLRENDCTSLVICFTDAQGCVLRLYGNLKDIAALQALGVSEGSSLSERVIGTNALGTCIYTHKQVYVCRSEHYKASLHGYISYGAPIFDEHNELVAAIGVFSLRDALDKTWLSLITQTASSISKECVIYHQRHDLQDIQANMDCLINTMNFGVVLLDDQARIVKANSVARYFFLMYEYELLGYHISTFISPQDIDFSLLESDIYNQEVTIHSGEVKQFRFLASVYLTTTAENKRNYVLIFNKALDRTELLANSSSSTAKWHFDDIVGTHPVLLDAVRLGKIASKTNCTVLLTGESGVGKELFAQAIHNSSNCSSGPFIAVNCGAIPKGLAESELFGYENGAFTGAKRTGMPGKFELANGGTIFLDEIGDMSLELQICLLRFLQEHEVTRVGGKKPIKLNVRVIAATNKNLEEAINNGVFRMDLYYRLNVFNLHVPSLRERPSDIGNLAHYFLQKYKIQSSQSFVGFTPEALSALQNYSWPGNVRELENVIERAVIISRSDRLRLDDLPEKLRSFYKPKGMEAVAPERPAAQPAMLPLSSEQTEQELILRALRSARGNVTQAAAIVGVSRRTLYRKMEKYNISK